MGLLGDIYSLGNTVKRNIKGLLADPSGTIEQWGDQAKNYRNNVVPTISGGLLDNRKMTEAEQMQKTMELASVAPIGIFAGVNAKTADLAKQAMAEKMLKAGDDPAKVWMETGWGKGPDGKWRFEIPDNKSFYRGSKASGSSYANDVMLHPDLYGAYPGVGNIRVREFDGVGGGIDELATKMDVGIKGNASETALHELQHAVQGSENFARGGSPEIFETAAKSYRNAATRYASNEDGMARAIANGGVDPTNGFSVKDYENNLNRIKSQMAELEAKGADRSPFWSYQRLAGEAEARLTQSRMNMDASQRAAQYPWEANYFQETTGVPLNGLLFRYD